MLTFDNLNKKMAGIAAFVLMAIMMSGCTRPLAVPGGKEAYLIMTPTPANLEETYRLGAGDVVAVNVFGQPDMSVASVIVDPAGEVNLPLIGPVKAERMTTRELSLAIESRLKPRYLVDPHVSVNVTDYVSKFVTIDGQVARPGVIPIAGTTTLLGIIARSGGPTNLAKLDEVAIFREIDGKRMAAKFNLRAIRRGEMDDPIVLGSDTVVVGFDRIKGVYRDALQALPIFAIFQAF